MFLSLIDVCLLRLQGRDTIGFGFVFSYCADGCESRRRIVPSVGVDSALIGYDLDLLVVSKGV